MNLDNIAHILEAGAIFFSVWRFNRGFNRILDALENFPPHRHVNGNIAYPKGFEPPEVEKINVRPQAT